MVTTAGMARASESSSFGALLRQDEDDGQPILLSAVWLVPGVAIGAIVVALLLLVRKR